MLNSILRPKSVAVVGASRRVDSIGYRILHNLVTNGFVGPVYPVNPVATSVHSIPAFPSISALPEAPELAIVVVPKGLVYGVVEECAEQGVRGLVVISAGFREVGGAGAEAEAELLRLVRDSGMRMVGPNCMGVMNTSADVRLNGTFAPTMPPSGTIAFMSQSGAMGVTILDYAAEYGIGINQFVSVGNKADVSGNDLMEYWKDDPGIDVILMYLESFGNPRTFTRLARETTRHKPIVVVKGGRTEAGARAASSHTGALAEVDIATDALLEQCGVIRVDSVEELFDAAKGFSNAPLPAGPSVAIITNAGGPGIITADACEAAGLSVTALSQETQKTLREGLPEEASVANPVDMIASATPAQFERTLEVVLTDPTVDSVIAAYVPVGLEMAQIVEAMIRPAGRSDKPMLAVLMGKKGFPQGLDELREANIPAYRFPEGAARALGKMWKFRSWQDRPIGEIREFDTDDDRVRDIIDGVLADGRERLTMVEAFSVLEAYGIHVAPYGVARTVAEAKDVAEVIGYPVVLKAITPRIVHKTEAGAVRLDKRSREDVGRGFARIEAALHKEAIDPAESGVLVQRMLKGGKETIVGMSWEPRFGPIIMFGLGGVYVEVLRDVVFRLQPVSEVDAAEMITTLRGYRILEGVRGEPGVDIACLEEVIQRVSQLVGRHSRIREMDINPFLAYPDSDASVAVDARFAVTS